MDGLSVVELNTRRRLGCSLAPLGGDEKSSGVDDDWSGESG
jgi:hypothetical protein